MTEPRERIATLNGGLHAQEQQLRALGRHVLAEQGDSSQSDSTAAARAYLASAEAQQLRLSDVQLLAADHKLHAQHAAAGAAFSGDEAALSAAMFSPVGTISDMLAGKDMFHVGQGDAYSSFADVDAVSLRLNEVAGLQSAYKRRLEVSAFPVALQSQHQY